MSSLSHPKPGSRRVEAWIYTVINPVIEGLRREAHLLESRNLSWRWYSQRCEYIRPIREYIEPDVMPNFEDFLAENGTFLRKFDEHDRALAASEGQATALYGKLIADSVFQGHVAQDFQKYQSEIVSSQPQLSIEHSKEHLAKYVAENLINNTRELPNHYTLHSFWKSYGNDFQHYLAEFDRHTRGKSFHELQQATNSLRDVSSNLLRELESQRLSLCREFDVPAAPPPVRAAKNTLSS